MYFVCQVAATISEIQPAGEIVEELVAQAVEQDKLAIWYLKDDRSRLCRSEIVTP